MLQVLIAYIPVNVVPTLTNVSICPLDLWFGLCSDFGPHCSTDNKYGNIRLDGPRGRSQCHRYRMHAWQWTRLFVILQIDFTVLLEARRRILQFTVVVLGNMGLSSYTSFGLWFMLLFLRWINCYIPMLPCMWLQYDHVIACIHYHRHYQAG